MTNWNGPSEEFKIYSFGDRDGRHILLRETQDSIDGLLPKGKTKYSFSFAKGDEPYFNLVMEASGYQNLQWVQKFAEDLLSKIPCPYQMKVRQSDWVMPRGGSKTFFVVRQGTRVFVYDSSISRNFTEEQILGYVVSLDETTDDDSHRQAINLADLFR